MPFTRADPSYGITDGVNLSFKAGTPHLFS
jgi:hypothetical protein